MCSRGVLVTPKAVSTINIFGYFDKIREIQFHNIAMSYITIKYNRNFTISYLNFMMSFVSKTKVPSHISLNSKNRQFGEKKNVRVLPWFSSKDSIEIGYY